MNKHRYDVALSFAGEERTYVEQVVAALEALEVKVFYGACEDQKISMFTKLHIRS